MEKPWLTITFTDGYAVAVLLCITYVVVGAVIYLTCVLAKKGY